MNIRLLIVITAIAALAGFVIGWQLLSASRAPHVATPSAPGIAYVGSAVCATCHRAEAALWSASHHAHAMAVAGDGTVLGDFANATVDHFGVRSRFFRRNGKFFVETDGADGRLADFEVLYTFGIAPLQQYLVALPGGRLQALPFAWDSRSGAKRTPLAGGGWFHLYPNENIANNDPLQWTGAYQNWNHMCAECHSTGVRKNYDAARNTFATHWSEISVGCEACHGQGSAHVAWARGKRWSADKGLLVSFDERAGVAWRRVVATGNAQRSASLPRLRKEVETCGRCHARRTELSEDWIPGRWLSDTHLVSPLTEGLYQPDGQMLDEVYNYGSFKQSKMFARGVTCSDCHDPHSSQLRASGANVCLQCHAASKYNGVAHTHHTAATVNCVTCHMPERTYMVIDRRHDHSFRIPRPDLSVTLGTPNACNDCHTDRPAQWAASAVARWFGPGRLGFQNYGNAFHDAWSGAADSDARLRQVILSGAPAFARAGAWATLAQLAPAFDPQIEKIGLADSDPMVRIATLDTMENMRAAQTWPVAAPLLRDPVRGVRIRAAWVLAGRPDAQQQAEDREAYARASAEFVAAYRLNADRADARAMLGSFYVRRGERDAAETEFRAGMQLAPRDSVNAIDLADLYRQEGRDGDAERVLRAAVASAPQDPRPRLAHGLALVRLHQNEVALAELRQADTLGPGQAINAYVYAIALNSLGHPADAIRVLRESFARHPADRQTLAALATISRDAGDEAAALNYARALQRLAPNDDGVAQLVNALRQQNGGRKTH